MFINEKQVELQLAYTSAMLAPQWQYPALTKAFLWLTSQTVLWATFETRLILLKSFGATLCSTFREWQGPVTYVMVISCLYFEIKIKRILVTHTLSLFYKGSSDLLILQTLKFFPKSNVNCSYSCS